VAVVGDGVIGGRIPHKSPMVLLFMMVAKFAVVEFLQQLDGRRQLPQERKAYN
jgi:hypothetical protein